MASIGELADLTCHVHSLMYSLDINRIFGCPHQQTGQNTEYFIKEIRRQCDKNIHDEHTENINTESNNTAQTEDLPLNTQELIEDATERRKLNINQHICIACDQCDFTTASKTQ